MEVESKLRRLHTVGPPVKSLPTSSTEADNVDYLAYVESWGGQLRRVNGDICELWETSWFLLPGSDLIKQAPEKPRPVIRGSTVVAIK